jgi:PEP-CTERM motif
MISSFGEHILKKFAFSFLLVAGLLCASPITTTVKLVDVGHPAQDDGHYYVGPYDLLINGQTVAALCIDFSDHTSTGTSWTAYVSDVGGDISHTYHPTFDVKYQEEAYLYSLITQPGADRKDIQHAAWAITGGYYANSDAQYYVNLAKNNYDTLDLAGYQIVSGINWNNHEQEFLIYNPPCDPVAPEPASLGLFGLGLAGAFAARRWRKK